MRDLITKTISRLLISFMVVISVSSANAYMVGAGSMNSCALGDSGVACWGSDGYGNTSVPPLINLTQLSVGFFHICALDDTGVVCWGSDQNGQSSVPALNNPVQVSAGAYHTCAIDGSGVVCWGETNGSIGPWTVPSLINPRQVSVGAGNACALDDTGVVCWGDGGTSILDLLKPALSNPVQITVGSLHACALDDRGVVCWGNNVYGQLDVPALSNPSKISTLDNLTCALNNTGVKCWGDSNNLYGQMDVPSLSNPIQVSAGYNHACALDDTGVVCWGDNSFGQLDAPNDILFPKPPLTLTADTPYWDSRDPAGPAVQLRWSSTSYASDYEVYRDGVKIYPTTGVLTEKSFRNEIGLTPGQTYSYQILANNTNGSPASNVVTVGPMPSEPMAPTILSVSPAVLDQGNSYQEVDITGSDFTTSSWHQFSLDGGITWEPAQSAPTLNDNTSISVAISNTVVREIYVRVCSSYGSNTCSSGFPVNISSTTFEVTPKVSRVLPHAIVKGTGATDVTISGSAFSESNRHQLSINGDNWFWPVANVTVNSDTSLTVGIDDTQLGTVRLRVCASQGSDLCSESLVVRIDPALLTTPELDSISYAMIPEGAGYQNVTLSGSEFSNLSFHQFSTNGGVTWEWADSAPVDYGPDSITVKVDNTTSRTLEIRVCQMYGSNNCSLPVSLNILTQQREQDPNQTGGVPSLSENAIFITHGNLSNASSWVYEMAKAICVNLNGGVDPVYVSSVVNPQMNKNNSVIKSLICQVNNWDVWVGDWQESAKNGFPWHSALNAIPLGEELGEYFQSRYQYVHLIAHSAGSSLINSATNILKNSFSNPPIVHTTFMDPYDPFVQDGGVSSYGKFADWSDNYVDTRDGLATDGEANGFSHKVFLDSAYNIDVTPGVLEDGCFEPYRDLCSHSRPYRFYGLSATGIGTGNDYVGDTFYSTIDPVYSTALQGFPLSIEASGIDIKQLATSYPKKTKCIVEGDVCTNVDLISTTAYFSSPAYGGFVVEVASGGVDLITSTAVASGRIILSTVQVINPFSITSAATASVTPSDIPAYLDMQITTDSPVNMLQFNWAVDSSGEGLLRVFVDGELVREIDQRYVVQASTLTENIYIGGESGVLPPAKHDIQFRFDGFGDNPSNIVISELDLGLQQTVAADGIYVYPYAGAGGSISVNAPQLVNTGENFIVEVTADQGYETNSMVGGSCLDGGWVGDIWTTGVISENCTVSFNFELLDSDNDAIPNIEDIDDDNDGVNDSDDNFPLDPAETTDTDGDGIGNNADMDDDNDSVLDNLDNCTLIPNSDQRDTDNDTYGNACDPDFNNDGAVNFADLAALKSVFLTTDPDADLNGDGAVNFADLAILKSMFLQPPGPSGITP